MALPITSHIINVTVLVWLLAIFATNGSALDPAYGPDGPARRILICVYAAICGASIFALIWLLVGGDRSFVIHFSITLFSMQVAYKIATAFTVGIDNPVVISNLAISGVHCVSLLVLWHALNA